MMGLVCFLVETTGGMFEVEAYSAQLISYHKAKEIIGSFNFQPTVSAEDLELHFDGAA